MIENEQAFEAAVQIGRLILEEGTVRGRGSTSVSGLTRDLGAAAVNGPEGNKGQYLWDGTYTVELDRGVFLDNVYHICGMGHSAQDQRVFAHGERVTVSWINRRNIQVPVILDGCTIDFYNKQLLGNGQLLDIGERVIRAAMANSPGVPGDRPFSSNQFDDPATLPGKVAEGSSDQNIDRIVRLPGGEVFLDKFGRVITLSRNPGHEFLVTNGKIDSGQDDVSDLDTVSDQDAYYDKITDDEAEPINKEEPFAPKTLNLFQYQQTLKTLKVLGDKDPNRTVRRGILPRFDRWIFKPILVRKYKADSDGQLEADATYSVRQERSQTDDSAETPIYGYAKTVTDQGDIKEFVPRHINQRVVGDVLQSIGGNYELKVKTTDRLPDGSPNPTNLVHREYLADGTVRLRINENVQQGKAAYDQKISPDGTMELYIKQGGATSSDNNISIKYGSDGVLNIKTKSKIVIDSDDKVYVGGETGAQSMMLGDMFKTLMDGLYNALATWVPISGDGGAALKTALTAFFTDYAQSLTPGSPNYYLSQDQKVV